MKIFIIDTLNVIFKSKDLKNKNKENAVSSFCIILSNYIKKYPSYKIMLIVDGTISNINNYHKNISIIESLNITADNKIKEIVESSPLKNKLEVVSSDTEVYNFARMNGINVILSEDFLKMINFQNINRMQNKSNKSISDTSKPQKSSKKEIEELSQLFKQKSDDFDIY